MVEEHVTPIASGWVTLESWKLTGKENEKKKEINLLEKVRDLP